MKVISLGYTCYVKDLIKQTNFNKDTDIFDWINSFEFSKNVKSLDNKYNIFENIIKSPLNIDLNSNNVYYNTTYSFRIPHETNLDESKKTYERRYERFINYKTSDEKFVFIRQINRGRYSISLENLENNYNNEIYEKIISYLPTQSIILLITHEKLSLNDKNKISNNFILLDNSISPDHIAYGDYLFYKNNIIKYYNELLNYINNNFNKLDINVMKEFIKNEKIGINN
tara:strand:+ start:610 stop:1293 length:684 start_codon:yes stop_codon:yes gene_type:complete